MVEQRVSGVMTRARTDRATQESRHRRAPVAVVDWRMPCIEIKDAPRFGWRGGMLDIARHLMPIDFLFRFVDPLAMHKFNVLRLDCSSRPPLPPIVRRFASTDD